METNRKRTTLQAYFAGIFDGEGCVSVPHRYNGTYKLQASIKMDDPQAALMVWREYPEACLSRRTRYFKDKQGNITGGKPYFDLTLTHYKAERFLQDLLPFSLIKHEQIKVGLSFIAHRRRDHANHKGFDCQGRCKRYADIMAALKHDPKGVNSVNALLDHGMREYRAKLEEVEQDLHILLAKYQEMLNDERFDIRNLREGVETSGEDTTSNKPISAPEKEIVHTDE
jgi:hypothetical protein